MKILNHVMIMRKIITFSITMLICTASFAQKKGSMYVGGTLGLSTGTETTTIKSDGYKISETNPSTTEFLIGADFGYFIANNLRLSVGISVPLTSKPYGKIDNEWAYSTITLCAINPNIAYYLKLVDRFYYTPEVGVNFHFGGLSQKVKGSQDLSLGCWGVGAYLKFASFEFKVTDKIALGLNFGSLSYNSMNVNQKEFKDSLALSSFNFSLNSAEASFKYYF